MLPAPFAALALLTLLLSACGGGGGGGEITSTVAPIGEAPLVAPKTFQVNPAASWKPLASNQDYFGGSLASVSLASLGPGSAAAGDPRTIELQAQGSFQYNAVGDLANQATGLFVDANGKPVAPLSLAPSAASPSAAADCGQSTLPDSIPEDFLIPQGSPVTVVVPATATDLRLSVSDCFYKDNRLSGDPLRVTVTPR